MPHVRFWTISLRVAGERMHGMSIIARRGRADCGRNKGDVDSPTLRPLNCVQNKTVLAPRQVPGGTNRMFGVKSFGKAAVVTFPDN